MCVCVCVCYVCVCVCYVCAMCVYVHGSCTLMSWDTPPPHPGGSSVLSSVAALDVGSKYCRSPDPAQCLHFQPGCGHSLFSDKVVKKSLHACVHVYTCVCEGVCEGVYKHEQRLWCVFVFTADVGVVLVDIVYV